MLYIDVSPDKISADLFPELRAWIDDLNLHRSNPVNVTMAVEDDIVQGIAVHEPGNILYLYVQEDVRLSGVATYLLKRVVNTSRDGIVSACVHSSNVDGMCFLLKSGFRLESWYTGVDDVRYLRMTNKVNSVHTPSEDKHLASFIKNVPIFLSMAGGNF